MHLRGLTFELSGTQRHCALGWPDKMSEANPARPARNAVACPLERVVSRQHVHRRHSKRSERDAVQAAAETLPPLTTAG